MASDAAAVADFDLHGLVGIRLLDARPQETKMLTRQLGPVQRPLEREPDIAIRFVDRLTLTSRLILLGLEDAGFTDSAFLILRGKHKSSTKVQVPFEAVGKGCELIAERGLKAVPLLVGLVNLTMVSKGILPLHAAAFEYQGVGALATGWAKGGKTEMLLAYAAHGARYVGDEWVYLTADGQRMLGLPEPIRLWKWHFDSMPEYWRYVNSADRAKLQGLDWVSRTMDRVADGRLGAAVSPLKGLRRASPLVKRQLNVQIPPERLFERVEVAAASKPAKLFFVASHDAPDLLVEKADPVEVAQRMVFSFLEEHADILSYYMKFRFAFPERRNDLLDTLEERVRSLLLRALSHLDTYAVYHPHPAPIAALYDATCGLFPAQP